MQYYLAIWSNFSKIKISFIQQHLAKRCHFIEIEMNVFYPITLLASIIEYSDHNRFVAFTLGKMSRTWSKILFIVTCNISHFLIYCTYLGHKPMGVMFQDKVCRCVFLSYQKRIDLIRMSLKEKKIMYLDLSPCWLHVVAHQMDW